MRTCLRLTMAEQGFPCVFAEYQPRAPGHNKYPRVHGIAPQPGQRQLNSAPLSPAALSPAAREYHEVTRKLLLAAAILGPRHVRYPRLLRSSSASITSSDANVAVFTASKAENGV